MDDPWGSPWAADSPPKIDIPAAPPAVARTGDNGTRANLWEDEDAWGGWNGAASGSNSPGWGRSPGLRPAATSSRDVSPGPWGPMEGSLGEGIVDSAMRPETRLPSEAALNAQDVWQTAGPVAAEGEPAPLVIEIPTRPNSPDGPPPGPALRSGERPESVRQGSKVQELVDMYDGITKQSASPKNLALTPPPTRKPPPVDHEIFEQTVESGSDSSMVSLQDDSPTGTLDPCQPVDVSGGNTIAARDDLQAAVESQDQAPQQPAERMLKAGAPVFAVDLSKLDELFPSVSPPETDPEPIPSVIIDDTFSSVSERKAWYRTSRFGSKRKHDLGNDENYVCMNWKQSSARADTLKIVRRWMEEDSITGRVVLGARKPGPIGASMFNWDSSAPPVEVSELFGKKSGHSRQTSKDSKVSAASPTTATFSWSSSAASPTTASHPTPPQDQPKDTFLPPKNRPQSLIIPHGSRAAKVSELASPSRSRPKSLVMPPGSTTRPSIDQTLAAWNSSPAPDPAAAGNVDEGDDDDDDWGEMVSSPTVGANTTFEESPLPTNGTNGGRSSPKLFDTEGPKNQEKPQTADSPVKAQLPGDPWTFGDTGGFSDSQPPTAESSAPFATPRKTTTQMSLLPSGPAKTQATYPVTEPSQDADDDDDATVARILSSLPDLSYMLR